VSDNRLACCDGPGWLCRRRTSCSPCEPVLTACCTHHGSAAQRAAIGRLRAQAPEELEVPPRGAAAELAGLTGVWAAVKYLVSVGAQHMDLIQAHAQYAALLLSLLLAAALPPRRMLLPRARRGGVLWARGRCGRSRQGVAGCYACMRRSAWPPAAHARGSPRHGPMGGRRAHTQLAGATSLRVWLSCDSHHVRILAAFRFPIGLPCAGGS